MIRALSFKMAYRHVRARWRQMALSVVAVALGVALVVGIQLMNAAVLQSFLDTADAMAGRADLTVSAGPGLTFAEDTAAAVAQVPGVKLAVPLVRGVAFPDDGSGELLTVHGVDLANDAAVRLYHTRGSDNVVQGDLLAFLNAPNNIILGREFADRRGLKVDDTLPLVTPHGVQPFIIKGLLDPEGLAKTLGGRLIVMDLFAAERAFATEGQISQIDVVVEKGTEPEPIKRGIAATLPAGLQVEEPALRKNVIRRTVGTFQLMLSAFSLLAVLAGFVICYSRLNAVFEARIWQVGLLRAIGLSSPVVFAELLKESVVLGASGTALGLGLGAMIGRVALPFFAQTTALAFRVPVPNVAAVGIDGQAALAGLIVGVGAALAAAVMPALRFARTQPVAALRMRGRETPPAPALLRWFVRLLVYVSLISLLVLGQRITQSTSIGHVTTALIALAVLLGARPLTAAGSMLLGGVWESLLGPPGRLAARLVQWQPRRSALIVATLGAGIGAVLLFGMLGWSLERTVVARLGRRIQSDLVLSSAFISGGYRDAPLSETVLPMVASLPGIDIVVGEEERDVELDSGDTIVIDAYDAPCFSSKRVCVWDLDYGSAADVALVAAGEAVLVSTTFSRHYGTRPGDRVTVPSPRGPAAFVVAGITRAHTMESIIMNRETYRELWNDPFLYLVHVSVSSSANVGSMSEAIRRTVGQQYRLVVRSRTDLLEYLAGKVREAFSAQYIAEAVTLLLVLVGIGDTLAAGVIEQTRRFATMRALGLSRRHISTLVVIEGATIGILGLVLAGVVGFALGLFWVLVQFPALLGWQLELHFPYEFAASAGVLTLGLCLIGSLLPARRAARLVVARALRND